MILTIVFWTVLLIINAVWVMFHPWAAPTYAAFLYTITLFPLSVVVLYRWTSKNRID